MADVVTTQTIINGKRNLILKAVDVSDGTGIINYKLVDAAALGLTPGKATIWDMKVDVRNGRLQVIWDGATPRPAFVSGGTGDGNFKFHEFGGITNNAASPTGDILLTFDSASLGSSFTLVLELKKNQ